MKLLITSVLGLILLAAPALAEMALYFAPNGGWAPENKNRVIVTEDGRQLAPTLNNAVLDLIDRTQEGGSIKIAMYAFSDRRVQEALIEAAFQRKIKVKVLLDGVADWTKDIRRKFIGSVARARANAPGYYSRRFQIKVVYKSAFAARGRTKKLRDGKAIFGTMHEKFGVFYQPSMKIPFDCFAGSSNISFGSDQKFGENRFVFRNDPVVARQFAEQFARLWNEYGTDALKNAESEPLVPAGSVVGGVRVIFNGKPIDEERFQRIDDAILESINRVRYKDGTIDIMMFSFTHWQLAQRILEIAQRYPGVKIRILMDQTQVLADDEHRGILGPYIEEQVEKLNIMNLQVRYKFRKNMYYYEEPAYAKKDENKEANAVGDGTAGDPSLDGVPPGTAKLLAAAKKAPRKRKAAKAAGIHWRSLILHHKAVIVNGRIMVTGSFNWSASAERRNFEDVMIFQGRFPGHQRIVDRMLAEFNYLWDSGMPKKPIRRQNKEPQIVDGPTGRALIRTIIDTLSKPNMKPIMQAIDASNNGIPLKQ